MNINVRDTVIYLDNGIETSNTVASISEATQKLQLYRGAVIDFNQIIKVIKR